METTIKSFKNSVKHWYLPLILGIMFIICGLWAFRSPLATYVALSILFSASFIVSGIADIAFSTANTKTLKGWGWYLVSGLISFLLGIYLVLYPGISMRITAMSILGIIFCFLLLGNPIFTGMSIVVMTALSFIFIGIASIVLSFNLKRIKKIFKEYGGETNNL